MFNRYGNSGANTAGGVSGSANSSQNHASNRSAFVGGRPVFKQTSAFNTGKRFGNQWIASSGSSKNLRRIPPPANVPSLEAQQRKQSHFRSTTIDVPKWNVKQQSEQPNIVKPGESLWGQPRSISTQPSSIPIIISNPISSTDSTTQPNRLTKVEASSEFPDLKCAATKASNASIQQRLAKAASSLSNWKVESPSESTSNPDTSASNSAYERESKVTAFVNDLLKNQCSWLNKAHTVNFSEQNLFAADECVETDASLQQQKASTVDKAPVASCRDDQNLGYSTSADDKIPSNEIRNPQDILKPVSEKSIVHNENEPISSKSLDDRSYPSISRSNEINEDFHHSLKISASRPNDATPILRNASSSIVQPSRFNGSHPHYNGNSFAAQRQTNSSQTFGNNRQQACQSVPIQMSSQMPHQLGPVGIGGGGASGNTGSSQANPSQVPPTSYQILELLRRMTTLNSAQQPHPHHKHNPMPHHHQQQHHPYRAHQHAGTASSNTALNANSSALFSSNPLIAGQAPNPLQSSNHNQQQNNLNAIIHQLFTHYNNSGSPGASSMMSINPNGNVNSSGGAGGGVGGGLPPATADQILHQLAMAAVQQHHEQQQHQQTLIHPQHPHHHQQQHFQSPPFQMFYEKLKQFQDKLRAAVQQGTLTNYSGNILSDFSAFQQQQQQQINSKRNPHHSASSTNNSDMSSAVFHALQHQIANQLHLSKAASSLHFKQQQQRTDRRPDLFCSAGSSGHQDRMGLSVTGSGECHRDVNTTTPIVAIPQTSKSPIVMQQTCSDASETLMKSPDPVSSLPIHDVRQDLDHNNETPSPIVHSSKQGNDAMERLNVHSSSTVINSTTAATTLHRSEEDFDRPVAKVVDDTTKLSKMTHDEDDLEDDEVGLEEDDHTLMSSEPFNEVVQTLIFQRSQCGGHGKRNRGNHVRAGKLKNHRGPDGMYSEYPMSSYSNINKNLPRTIPLHAPQQSTQINSGPRLHPRNSHFARFTSRKKDNFDEIYTGSGYFNEDYVSSAGYNDKRCQSITLDDNRASYSTRTRRSHGRYHVGVDHRPASYSRKPRGISNRSASIRDNQFEDNYYDDNFIDEDDYITSNQRSDKFHKTFAGHSHLDNHGIMNRGAYSSRGHNPHRYDDLQSSGCGVESKHEDVEIDQLYGGGGGRTYYGSKSNQHSFSATHHDRHYNSQQRRYYNRDSRMAINSGHSHRRSQQQHNQPKDQDNRNANKSEIDLNDSNQQGSRLIVSRGGGHQQNRNAASGLATSDRFSSNRRRSGINNRNNGGGKSTRRFTNRRINNHSGSSSSFRKPVQAVRPIVVTDQSHDSDDVSKPHLEKNTATFTTPHLE